MCSRPVHPYQRCRNRDGYDQYPTAVHGWSRPGGAPAQSARRWRDWSAGLLHGGGTPLLCDLFHSRRSAFQLRSAAPPDQLADVRLGRMGAKRQLPAHWHPRHAVWMGVRSSVRALGGGRTVPILLIAVGSGLIGAGLFAPDPLSGYPPGTPPTAVHPSAHRVVHDLCSTPLFTAWPAACIVLARRFGFAWMAAIGWRFIRSRRAQAYPGFRR